MDFSAIEDAIAFAAQAHRGQTDKSGQPYILHPLRVMLQMPDADTQIAAVLHDVIEDTNVTLEQLHSIGVAPQITDALDCLTHRRGEPYPAYIDRVRVSPIARKVKQGDLTDNLDPSRLSRLDEGTVLRLRGKYLSALNQLLAGDQPQPSAQESEP